MSVIDSILQVAKTGRIPYTYKVGEKSSTSLPIDVKLSMDKDFNKAVTKWVTIAAAGIGLGIAAGVVVSTLTKRRRK